MKCPDGHDSASTDYCDVCGMLMAPGGVSAVAPAAPVAAASEVPVASEAAAVSEAAAPEAGSAPAGPPPCPRCGAPKSGQFCESCGFNFAGGTPASGAVSSGVSAQPAGDRLAMAWTVIVSADRSYYDAVQATGESESGEIPFPAYCPERRFRLSGREVQVGRRSPSRGLDPEIDLTGPPLDPGISRLHAVLIALPEGGWAVIDPGSANGTQVNGTEIPEGQQIPLNDGDRISIGAWTTITIRAE